MSMCLCFLFNISLSLFLTFLHSRSFSSSKACDTAKGNKINSNLNTPILTKGMSSKDHKIHEGMYLLC